MRDSFRLAFSFIRVPRLFASLLFWPLILGLAVAVTQAVLSVSYFHFVNKTPEQVEENMMQSYQDDSWLRNMVFGENASLNGVKICRWQNGAIPEGCTQEPYHIVLHVEDPANFDTSDYVSHFSGVTDVLHLCTDCAGDLVLQPSDGELNIYSLTGLGVYMLSRSHQSRKLRTHLVNLIEDKQKNEALEGEVFLTTAGYNQKIHLSSGRDKAILVVNMATFVIVILWLALKAHHKVLDYFASNNALLPMVAACGKEKFYLSLWIITGIRVLFFLLAALPATIFCYTVLDKNPLDDFAANGIDFTLWLIGIFASLGVVALVASLSELKKRTTFFGFVYRYAPLIWCLGGFVLWATLTMVSIEHGTELRNLISSIPIVGLVPILVAPILPINPWVIAFHVILSVLCMTVLMKRNSRWFASHLEAI